MRAVAIPPLGYVMSNTSMKRVKQVKDTVKNVYLSLVNSAIGLKTKKKTSKEGGMLEALWEGIKVFEGVVIIDSAPLLIGMGYACSALNDIRDKLK